MARALLVAVSVVTSVVAIPSAERSTYTAEDITAALGPLGFTRGDVERVELGGVASRSLPAADGREVATAGVVRVNAAPDEFVRRLSDIVNFKTADAVLQIGVFSSSPQAGDVAALTLDSGEIGALRNCRVGHCEMQLTTSIIDTLQRDVNWNGASASQQVTDIIRTGLLRLVQHYRTTGREDVVYVDDKRPVDVSAEFRALVDSDRYVLPRFPDLRQYLVQPTIASGRVSDVIYWSKEKIARKAVISVTHLVIAPQPATSPVAYLAASRQLYGSHYFDSSLGLTMVMRDDSDPSRSYVAYVNRSRVDTFSGLFAGITRGIVRSKARGALAEFLAHLQRRFDTPRQGE